MNKPYWNPYTRETLTHYQDTWREALSWEGKNVVVIKENGDKIKGTVSKIATCSNGGLGLVISTCFGIDRWVGPEFTSIEEIIP